MEANPTNCPTDSTVYIYHLEAGEYLIEFMHHDVDTFNMTVMEMAGAHNHDHDHGHDDHGDEHDDHEDEDGDHDEHDHDEEGDHDEHDHDEEGDHDEHDHDDHDDHDDHGDDHDDHDEHEDDGEEITPDYVLEQFDTNNDSHLSWEEFVESLEEDDHDEHANETHDENETHDHNETHDDNETHEEHMEYDMDELMNIFNESDVNSDGLMNASELEHFIEEVMEYMESFEHEGHADGYAMLHIEESGDYGIGIDSDIDFEIVPMGEHDHDDHGDDHDDHDDHGDDHDDHDDHGDEEGHDDHDDHGDDHDDHGDEEGHDDHDDHGDDHDDHDDHGDEEGVAFDPHSWLDPVAFKHQLEVALEIMVVQYPELEETFRANAASYSDELDSIHQGFEAAFGANGICENNLVVANHNAYSYMGQRYNINFVTVHGLDPEGEPSAADIEEVVEEIEEEGLTVLFVEEYTDRDAVQSIVQQTVSDDLPNGIAVEYLYTMELPPIDSSDDYISLMNANLANLKTGLSC